MEETNGLKYVEKDGIFYPDLGTSTEIPLGKYGRMKWKHLAETKRSLVMAWFMEGTMHKRMEKVDEEAGEMLERLQQEMLAKDPMPKTDDPLVRVRHLNAIRDAAEEIVLKELIYNN